MSGQNRLIKVSRETLSEVLSRAWSEEPSTSEDETKLALLHLLRNQHPLIVDEVFHCLKEHQPASAGESYLLVLVIEEEERSEDAEEVIVIPPLAYLRAMLMIAWSAFRHPWRATTIDLMTGRVIHRE